MNSRRLGNSLGINLLPTDCKICNFNCIYCECGWTFKQSSVKLLDAEKIEQELKKKLQELKAKKIPVDTITFAGNGEPTMHPEFDKIIDFTIRLRNEYFPKAKVAVLSNATLIDRKNVFEALKKVEMNILKLDSAYEETIKVLNNPPKDFSLEKTLENMKKFNGDFILQTMFVKGNYEGKNIDNTHPTEIKSWLKVVKELHPKMVMIYTIRRDTPINTLEVVPKEKLIAISKMVKDLKIDVSVSG